MTPRTAHRLRNGMVDTAAHALLFGAALACAGLGWRLDPVDGAGLAPLIGWVGALALLPALRPPRPAVFGVAAGLLLAAAMLSPALSAWPIVSLALALSLACAGSRMGHAGSQAGPCMAGMLIAVCLIGDPQAPEAVRRVCMLAAVALLLSRWTATGPAPRAQRVPAPARRLDSLVCLGAAASLLVSVASLPWMLELCRSTGPSPQVMLGLHALLMAGAMVAAGPVPGRGSAWAVGATVVAQLLAALALALGGSIAGMALSACAGGIAMRLVMHADGVAGAHRRYALAGMALATGLGLEHLGVNAFYLLQLMLAGVTVVTATVMALMAPPRLERDPETCNG